MKTTQGISIMKRIIMAMAIAVFGLSAVGCHHHNLASRGCGNAHCDRCGGHGVGTYDRSSIPPRLPPGYAQQTGPSGPPTAAVAYPYYTVRGPRDFFLNNPPTIGH